jgi:iron complex outermembrane receptor protein
MTKRMLMIGVSALTMIFSAATASAQAAAGSQAQAPSAANAPEEPDSALGDVIVTAQRRAERLQDVPLAVTAITADDLSRSRIFDASRLQLQTPGLTWGQQGADSFPAIRGVRTQLVDAKTDPVIGFYLDGVYQSRTQQQSIPLFDLARVEVQRGPQGTLYGRNTFGGNISVVTQEPTKELSAGGSLSIGNYSLKQGDAFINLPINDWLSARVAGYHSDHTGYVTSTVNPQIHVADEDQNAVRGSLLATPTPELRILVHGGWWGRFDAGGSAYGYKTVGTLINAAGVRSILGSPYAVNPSVRNGSFFINGIDEGVPVGSDPYQNQFDYQPYERVKEKYIDGDVSYDLGGIALRSITGYEGFRSNRSGDIDQSGVVFPAVGVASGFAGSGIQAADTHVRTFSEELQLSSNRSVERLQWIVGGYLFHDHLREFYDQVYTAPTATTRSSQALSALSTHSYAAYGQATLAIVPDKLKLIGGIRYSDETKDATITNYTAPPGSFTYNVQTAAIGGGHAHYAKVTWKGGAEFNVTRDNLLYATVSTGFESGGINNNSSNALVPAAYAPQTVTAYEVGSKNKLLNGELFVNVSAFYNDYKNLQITILDQVTNLSYYANAGAARGYGAEFEVKTNFYRDLHVNGTASLLNAKYTQYTRPNPFGNTTTVNLSGNRVPMAPTFKGTLSAYYDIKANDGAALTPHVDLLYSTHYYATDYNTVLDRQNAYATLDTSLRYSLPNGRVYIEGFGDNLTKKAVIYSATLGSTARVQNSYSPPRTYGVRVGARF